MGTRIFCFLSLILFVIIGTAACSGDDTGVEVMFDPEIEVTPEPEPVEEVIPEPVVETVDVPTLESWGIEDGSLEIVNGNCNLPIFKRAPFPHNVVMKKIRSEQGAVGGGGPECRDDDNEGSLIELNCVVDRTFNGTFYYCKEGNEDHCYEREETDNEIDQCRIIPSDSNLTVKSGFSNFYDDLFKKSTFYIDTRGKEKHHFGKRSFIMAKTHISSSGNAIAGKLYGEYNPDSREYKDRKELWDVCGVGTKPPDIRGEWQAVKRNDYIEVCIRLDTLPGSVKCFVDNPDGPFVELHKNGRFDRIVVDTNEMDDRSTSLTLSIFSTSDFRRNQLCELFDEG